MRIRRHAGWIGGLLLLGALAAPGCGGAPPRRVAEMGMSGRAEPQTTVATRVDSTGAETPIVRVTVPYRSLIFVRQGERFTSGVRVTVVATRDGDRIGGGVSTTEATAPDFKATRGEGQLTCSVPLALKGTGLVDLEVVTSIEESSREWTQRLTYRSGAGLNIPLYFADFHWNLEGSAGGAGVLGVERDTLRAVVDLGRRPNVSAWPAGGMTLVAQVSPLPSGGRKQKPTTTDVPPRRVALAPAPTGSPTLPVTIAWPASTLPFGRLQLALRLETGGKESDNLDFEPPRTFVNLSVRFDDDEAWRQQIDWLEGILDRDQRHKVSAVPAGQRAAVWKQLWAKAAAESGTTATELERTHLLRILEADERFGGAERGAQSDRGRVFIRYGPPDSVERHGDEMGYEGQWEVWYYNTDRLMFTFYDAHGLGDFRLVGTSST